MSTSSFAEKYGPYAVVAGASEGTGRAFAHQIAAAGITPILVARREGPLKELADELQSTYGIEPVVASVDLARPDAAAAVIAAVGDREVGLYVANAGADPNGSRFLDADIQAWVDLMQRNDVTTVRLCHHFGNQMKNRGRGGLLLVNSGACYGGGGFLAVYSASKAFELNFAESLWVELRPYGVDVLTLVLGMTDTPAFRALLAEKGMPLPTEWSDPHDVAVEGLAHLADGPVRNIGQEDDVTGWASASAAERRMRVLGVTEGSKHVFGPL